jgi:hypothetical protein
MIRYWLAARVIIIGGLALSAFGLAIFRPNISIWERFWVAAFGTVLMFFAIRAERLRRQVRDHAAS